MSHEQSASSVVRVPARAKINLHLKVLGTRPDGYHDVVTVLQTLALQDTIRCELHDGFRFELRCDTPGVPLDESNLVWRAASALADAARPEGTAGTRVTIEKRIPMQAGLGGGSADAAAALVGLATLWGVELDGATWLSLARGLGADVAFLLEGGTQLGVGRGDELAPLAAFPEQAVLLVMPPFGVSTAEAYRWHDERVASAGAAGAGRPAAVSLASELALWPAASGGAGTGAAADGAVTAAAWAEALTRCENDFAQAIGPRHPEVAETVAALRAAGATFAAMTGSGAAIFGLFGSDEAATAAAARFEGPEGRPGWRTFVTRTAAEGVRMRG